MENLYAVSNGSSTIASKEDCPNPNPNAKPNPNPNPNWGAISLGGNCPDTVSN